MNPVNDIPVYSSSLAAYHRAFAPELAQLTRELPICSGDRVLDVGCGDGLYSSWLASLAAPTGEIVGVDQSEGNLASARARLMHHPQASRVRFQKGDAARLPFSADYFDVAWCAQNLFSFPDPQVALRELTRVVRPGGIVAIMENDSLHQILLSWPVDVELALAEAEFQFFQSSDHPSKYYIARDLRHLLRAAGLKPQRKRLYATPREAPFTPNEREFLRLYLEGLRERTEPYLDPARRRAVLSYLDPNSYHYVLNDEDLTMTCLDQVAWGKKPG